jgi:chromosomal replication initiator protein
MLTCKEKESWLLFLEFIKNKCTKTEYQNWIKPIQFLDANESEIFLQVPNIFVQQYLIDNYKEDLLNFLPKDENGSPSISFTIEEPKVPKKNIASQITEKIIQKKESPFESKLNAQYTFEDFIEGPSNQFVKSAAVGVAARPGKSFNPLFIHGNVGRGKTHLLHAIGHEIAASHKKIKIQCVTTEIFINHLVNSLRNKSIDKMKHFYRNLDVLLVDDIQFLQNRQNFEEEFCNTFESLINQHKQIVITSDKPPSQLQLSERMTARMEWGLVAHIGIPDLETRVAIIQHKSELKGFDIPSNVAFFIADHIYNNIRQLEGAINKLNAFCKLMKVNITEEIAENLLREMFEYKPQNKVTVESILKSVASVFELRISDITGNSRLKNIAMARQVAMFLAKELINESLSKIAQSFGGKTHSTLLHAWKKIDNEQKTNETLKRQIQMVKRNIEA